MYAQLPTSASADRLVRHTHDDRPAVPAARSDVTPDAVNTGHPLSLLERLPPELHQEVFRHLDDPADVCAVAATSTRLRVAIGPELQAMRQLAALIGSRDLPAALDEVLASAAGMPRFLARQLLPAAVAALMRLPPGDAGLDRWVERFTSVVDGLGRQPLLQQQLRQCLVTVQAYVGARDARRPNGQALASASSGVVALAGRSAPPVREFMLQSLVNDLHTRAYGTRPPLTGPSRPLLDMFTSLLKQAAKVPQARRMTLLTPLLLGARTLHDRQIPDAVQAVLRVTDELPDADRLEALISLRAGLDAIRWHTPQAALDLDLATAFYPLSLRQRAQARIDDRIRRLGLRN